MAEELLSVITTLIDAGISALPLELAREYWERSSGVIICAEEAGYTLNLDFSLSIVGSAAGSGGVGYLGGKGPLTCCYFFYCSWLISSSIGMKPDFLRSRLMRFSSARFG